MIFTYTMVRRIENNMWFTIGYYYIGMVHTRTALTDHLQNQFEPLHRCWYEYQRILWHKVNREQCVYTDLLCKIDNRLSNMQRHRHKTFQWHLFFLRYSCIILVIIVFVRLFFEFFSSTSPKTRWFALWLYLMLMSICTIRLEGFAIVYWLKFWLRRDIIRR